MMELAKSPSSRIYKSFRYVFALRQFSKFPSHRGTPAYILANTFIYAATLRLTLIALKMPPQNKAAWLRAPATPLSVGSAPYTPPGPQELVIKNGAVAINPVDWVIPDKRGMMFKWIKDPFILGTDGKNVAIPSPSLLNLHEKVRLTTILKLPEKW